MSKIISVIFVSLLSLNLVFAVETLPNTGLIQSNIWFSKDPFYSGDRIRIYSVIGNGSEKDIRGDVNFYDGDSLLCNTNFFILAGRITEAWCDWGVSPGAHNINVKIFRVKSSSPGVSEVDVELSNAVLGTSQRFAETRPEIKIPVPPLGVQPNQDSSVATNSSSDNVIVSAIGSIKEAIFGSATPESSKKVSSTPTIKNSTTKKELALNNVEKIKKDIGQVISSTPILNNTASVYSSLGDSILNPLNNWLEASYSSLTKGITNKPLLYFMAFLHFIFKYIIITPYFFTIVIFYLFYRLARYFYRRYKER